jgi:NADPH:quinone reductase-like Zn-dependent oxidoreductase
MVKSIGADHVIDYTKEDFTQGAARYDLIIDNVGSHTLSEYRRVLTPNGALVMVGGPSDNSWLGPLTTSLKAYLVSPFVKQKMIFMLAQANQDDLNVLRDLMQDGKLTPVIDRRYPLAETAQAIGYLEQGHAKGKVIITVDQTAP